jgi:hypothetical protein
MTFHSSLTLFHICTAVIGILSGGVATIVRKGSGLHRAAGDIFGVSMISMASAGAFIAAFLKPNIGNVMGGLMTVYLVSTGWMAGRRRERTTGMFDIIAAFGILALASAEFTFGIQAATSPTGLKAGYPPFLYFIFGSLAMLFAIADGRMIIRGGVAGAQRIVRHLWRMSVAFLFAMLSFYPSRAHLFSRAINDSHLLYIPHILVFGSMIFWIARLLGRRKGARNERYEKERAPRRVLVPVAHDGAV